MGIIAAIIRWICSRNLGGLIGIIIGIIIGVVGLIACFIGSGTSDTEITNRIFVAFFWAFLSVIGIPILGIVGTIIGGLVKIIGAAMTSSGRDGHKSFRLSVGRNQGKPKETSGGPEIWGRINAYIENGDYDKAIAESTELIRRNPGSVSGYSLRGDAYSKKGDNDKAIADYTAAIRVDPTFPLAYFSRAGIYLMNGDLEKAVADCTEALRFDPELSESYVIRGNAYFGLGDFDKAIADFTKMIRIAPNAGPVYCLRAVAHSKLGHVQEAIRDYEKFLELDPNNADADLARDALRELKSGKTINQ